MPAEAVETAVARKRARVPNLPELDLDLGVTPKDIVHTNGTLNLYRYRPVCQELYRVPVLLIPSLVSRAYIFDLSTGQSLVEFLLKKGFDVYLIDWGTPRAEHSGMTLEDYVLRLMPECIDVALREAREEEISMIGYCMGGQLACMYAATHLGGPLKNLLCLTTPIDSAGMPLDPIWTDPEHFDLDDVIKSLGNLPPELMSASLRPRQRRARQRRLPDNVEGNGFVAAFLRLSRWAADQVPLPGETARQFIVDFLRENKLMRNEMKIGSQRVDLGAVKVPFLHAAAEYDHIVPREASKGLLGLIGSDDKSEIVVKGAHVSMVAGGNAVYRLWPALDRWLAKRSI